MKKIMYLFISCIMFVLMFYCTGLVIEARQFKDFENGEIVKTGDTFEFFPGTPYYMVYLNYEGIPIVATYYNFSGTSMANVVSPEIGDDCRSNGTGSNKHCSNSYVNTDDGVSLEGIEQWRYLGITRAENNEYVYGFGYNFQGPMVVFREYKEPTIEFNVDNESIKPDDEVMVDIEVETTDAVKNIEFSINDEYFEVVDVDYKDNWKNNGDDTDYVLNPAIEDQKLFGEVEIATLKLKNIKKIETSIADVDLVKDIKFNTYFNDFTSYNCDGYRVESLNNKCVPKLSANSPFCQFELEETKVNSTNYYSSGNYVSSANNNRTNSVVKSYTKVPSTGDEMRYFDAGYVNGKYYASAYYIDGCDFDFARDDTEYGYNNFLSSHVAAYTSNAVVVSNQLYVEGTPSEEEIPKEEETKEEVPPVVEESNPETIDGIVPFVVVAMIMAGTIIISRRMKKIS